MNISIGEISRNKKNPFEYVVPPPREGRNNNQFLYDFQGETWSDTRILAVITVAYELIKIAELIKQETDSNVLIEPDENTMKCLLETKQGANNFDI